MEKRFIFALVLSMVALFTWSLFFAPKPEKPAVDPTTVTDGTDSRPTTRESEATPQTAPTTSQSTSMKSGFEVEGGTNERRTATLESDTLRLIVDNRGGVVQSAYLLDYSAKARVAKGEEPMPLQLLESYVGSPSALSLVDADDMTLTFLDEQLWSFIEESKTSVVFGLKVKDDKGTFELRKSIRLSPLAHRAEIKVWVESTSREPGTLMKRFWLRSTGGIHLVEEPPSYVSRSLVATVTDDGPEVQTHTASDVSKTSSRTLDVSDHGAVVVGDLSTYFGVYLRLESTERSVGARIRYREGSGKPGDTESVGPARTHSELGFMLIGDNRLATSAATFDWYLGPKDHRAIKRSYADADRPIYLEIADHELTAQGGCCGFGFLNFIIHGVSKLVLVALDFLHGLLGSVGLAIICLTFCVRLVLFPINRRSQAAMAAHGAKMQAIKPKLDALKEKYKDDQKVFAQKQLELMREEKVSFVPVGGCLPMFLQIPIFFGLFSAIRFDVSLRHASFLWVADLSRPDNLISWTPWSMGCCFGQNIVIDGLNILPLLMTVAWFIDAKMTPIPTSDPQLAQQQKMMQWMPFLFGFMLYSYAAGLSLYWLTSSLIGIFEKRVIKKFWPVPGSAPKPAAS